MAPASEMGFAALLRTIIVHEQNRKLKDVAEAVGLSTRNFYGRVTGRIQFTPDEINRVICAVPDPRLGDWLFANSDLACTRRTMPALRSARASAAEMALSGVEEGMAVLRDVVAAGPGCEMSSSALADAEAHILEAQRQLGALLMTLRAQAMSPAGASAGMRASDAAGVERHS